MAEEKTVHSFKLREPVQHGSVPVTELTFKRCKAKHLKDMPGEPNIGDLLRVVGRLTGLPPIVIDELDAADAQEAMEYVSSVFSSGQPTGSNA